MKKIVPIFWIILIPVFAQPPQWTSEQTALWEYMKASWEDDIAKNGKWPAEYTVDSYVAWGDKNPGPIDRASSIEWNRVTKDSETIIWYRITPMAIVVEGDTAVLMYYADTLANDKKGEEKRRSSRYTEVLIRQGRGWKFLSSTSASQKFGGE